VRLNKRRRPSSVGMDMTPMIDVVFQLIIFFMTVSQQSHLVATELELPRMAGARDQAPATLTINITHDGRIIVSGNPIGLAQLDETIQRALADRQGGPDAITTVLRVDRRGNSALVNRVVNRLRAAGLKRSRIAVEVSAPG
jgi:biopolymer transport protein ExbD